MSRHSQEILLLLSLLLNCASALGVERRVEDLTEEEKTLWKEQNRLICEEVRQVSLAFLSRAIDERDASKTIDSDENTFGLKEMAAISKRLPEDFAIAARFPCERAGCIDGKIKNNYIGSPDQDCPSCGGKGFEWVAQNFNKDI